MLYTYISRDKTDKNESERKWTITVLAQEYNIRTNDRFTMIIVIHSIIVKWIRKKTNYDAFYAPMIEIIGLYLHINPYFLPLFTNLINKEFRLFGFKSRIVLYSCNNIVTMCFIHTLYTKLRYQCSMLQHRLMQCWSWIKKAVIFLSSNAKSRKLIFQLKINYYNLIVVCYKL